MLCKWRKLVAHIYQFFIAYKVHKLMMVQTKNWSSYHYGEARFFWEKCTIAFCMQHFVTLWTRKKRQQKKTTTGGNNEIAIFTTVFLLVQFLGVLLYRNAVYLKYWIILNFTKTICRYIISLTESSFKPKCIWSVAREHCANW